MTYTAEFRQPRKQLNPLGLRMAAAITVELYHVGRNPVRWKARMLPAGARIPLPDSKADLQFPENSGGRFSLQSAVQALFEEQLSPWVQHLTEEEQKERDNPTPPLEKKPVATKRDGYGIKGT